MARARRGRAFKPNAGAQVPQQPVAQPEPQYVEQEQMGQIELSPAPQLGATYSQQAAAAFAALGMIQQNRLYLENLDACPDDLLDALDSLETAVTNLITATGQVIGELNAWATSDQE